MRYLVFLFLLNSCYIHSQIDVDDNVYQNLIYQFLKDQERSKDDYLLIVSYNHENELALNQLRGKKSKNFKIELSDLEILKTQSKIKHYLNKEVYKDLRLRFIKDRKTYYKEVKEKERNKKVNYKEALFLKKQHITFSQPLILKDKKIAFIPVTIGNSWGLQVYKFKNNRWSYHSLFQSLIF